MRVHVPNAGHVVPSNSERISAISLKICEIFGSLLFSRKPYDSLLVQKYSSWMEALHKHIESQVKLESGNAHGVVNVLLDDKRLVVNKVPNITDDENFASATEICRLCNPETLFGGFHDQNDSEKKM